MFKPLSLKILDIFFLVFSNSGSDLFSKEPRPSSLYNPIFFPPNSLFRLFSKCKTTNSHISAPSNAFENYLRDMIRNIEFKNVKSLSQQQLQNDVKRIKQDPKLLIPTDKTNNLYKLATDEYNKLLTKNIFKSYKKTDKSLPNRTNTEAKNIAKDLKLEERIEQHSQHQSFITLKDH